MLKDVISLGTTSDSEENRITFSFGIHESWNKLNVLPQKTSATCFLKAGWLVEAGSRVRKQSILDTVKIFRSLKLSVILKKYIAQKQRSRKDCGTSKTPSKIQCYPYILYRSTFEIRGCLSLVLAFKNSKSWGASLVNWQVGSKNDVYLQSPIRPPRIPPWCRNH